MPISYRKRIPGNELVPQVVYPQVPSVLVLKITTEAPNKRAILSGGVSKYINPEYGKVVRNDDETATCVLTHVP
jgi:hypothetical protein